MDGWVAALTVHVGDAVCDGNGEFLRIKEVAHVDGYFEVFFLTVNNEHHNFVANGLLCHNDRDYKVMSPR
jgi:hypothetical protein